LRAIPKAPGYFSQSMSNWSVNPYAFEPNKKRDTDGMSFFRLDFTTPEEVALSNLHALGALVGRVTVKQLRGMQLDVQCDPDENQLAGHVIVPGMKFVANRPKAEKREIAHLSQRLAQFATQNKVYSPR